MATGEVAIAVDNMAKKPEATPVADNPKEKVASRTDDPNSKKTTENSAKKDPDAQEPKYGAMLNNIFITSCVVGIFLDPLFLYIPLLDHDLKCLRLDNTLKIMALISRSFTDLFYIGRIIFQVARFKNCSPFIKSSCPTFMTSLFKSDHNSKTSITEEIWESSIIVDILAILPLPQVAILNFFPKMMVLGSFVRFIMNSLVMMQYVPRVFRIYLSCKKVRKSYEGRISLWAKALFNFLLYLLASHVLGAIWYFFATQQMMRCWQHACRYGNGCGATTFDCHEHQTLRNIRVLNDLCPINPPNTTLFDFGIYLNVLQSGALWPTNYPLKFLNSFCWGLRNLSSLASNLQPSFYIWEIIFVALITIIGLLLYVYLIGNLQTYLQLDTERRQSERFEEKIRKLLPKLGISLSRKKDIVEKIRKKLQGNPGICIDVHKEIISILRPEESPLSRLRNVPLLQDMDEGVLVEISEKLKPESYTTGNIIIEKDKTLEKMLFIVDGRAKIVNAEQCKLLEAGKFYGEELLFATSSTSSGDAKPINGEFVEAIVDVRALVLYATDMASIGFKSRQRWQRFNKLLMVTILKKVEIFKQMDEQVLKAISKRLKPMNFNVKRYILKEKKPLNMMFFVMRGVVSIESDSATDYNLYDGEKYVNLRKNCKIGDFYGEELVQWVTTWVSHQTFPTKLPLSPDSALCGRRGGLVKILVLKADDLKSVLSDFTLPTESDQPWDPLTILKNDVETLKTMDEKVLKEICGYLKLRTYEDTYIIQKDKPMEMMFFIVSGVVSVTNESSKHYRNGGGRPNHSGVDLIEHWLQSTDLPTSPFSFWAIGEVKVWILKADDLAKVQP